MRPPFYVSLTFVNVKGAEFVVPTPLTFTKNHAELIAREDPLTMPEIVIAERVDEVEKALRPLFDSVWNTFGFWGSFSYDDEGEWQKLRR